MKHFKDLKQLTDYQLRTELVGFGITLAGYCGQFSEFGTPEYEKLYAELFAELQDLKNKANEGVKKYRADVKYKQKKNEHIFEYKGTFEERNRDEVMQRLTEKKWINPYTGKKIKPEFLTIDIFLTQ
jgi:hypothetical protein